MATFSNQPLRQSSNLKVFLLKSKNQLLLQGPLGSYNYPIFFDLRFSRAERKLWLLKTSKTNLSVLGTAHVLLAQAMLGVLIGYRQQMNIVGIGYQVNLNNKTLVFKLGFSHVISILIPDSISATCLKSRTLLLKSMNYQKLQNFSALLRSLKFPNPYKEKGIYYLDEPILLKQGKKT